MSVHFGNINNLLEDTCVLAVFAFLLARGKMLRLLQATSGSVTSELLLGVVMGVFGWSDVLFPAARAPYTVTTLVVTFTGLASGIRAGFMAALVASGAVAFPLWTRLPVAGVGLLGCALIGAGMRRLTSGHPALLLTFLTGALAQTTALLVQAVTSRGTMSPETVLANVLANGFGVFLLSLIVSDAQERVLSEQRRKEIERRRAEAARLRALASEAQFAALRARIHPHFLFNALNAIAELCCIAPERAEVASLHLSQLMRRALETSNATTIPLREELGLTRAYLQIEQERLGDRLHIHWRIDPACEAKQTVPFSVQVLAENAVNHGLTPKPEGGTVTIRVRWSVRRTVVAVQDDGVGMPPEAHPQRQANCRRIHGLQILNEQLILRYGAASRLRFFHPKEGGTLAVFALPEEEARMGGGEENL